MQKSNSGTTAASLTYYLFKELMPFSTHKCVCHSTGNVRLSQVKRMHKLKSKTESKRKKSTGFELDVSMYAIVSFCRTAHMHIHHEIKSETEREWEKIRKETHAHWIHLTLLAPAKWKTVDVQRKEKLNSLAPRFRELLESRCLACAYRKTHRNLMHLKRKIYFSILAVVNFKINMEMGWVFCCANTASQWPDIPNHFIWILDFNVQWLFELLWDDFNVTIDVCLFAWLWIGVILFFSCCCLFFFLSLSLFLVGIVFSR